MLRNKSAKKMNKFIQCTKVIDIMESYYTVVGNDRVIGAKYQPTGKACQKM